MKNIGLFTILILFFTGVQANDYYNTTPKKKQDIKLYKKYVYSPLTKSSSNITYGTLAFRMSIVKNKGEEPRTYDCTLEFSRWPILGSALSAIVLTIGDTLLFVTDKDSLFVFDLITKTHTTSDFKTALNSIYGNQFISFYAYYYSLSGKAENVFVVKDRQFVSCEFDFFPTLEKENIQRGHHHFLYETKTNLLRKYTYRPTGTSKEKSAFEKIECELINFQYSVSPSALKEWIFIK